MHCSLLYFQTHSLTRYYMLKNLILFTAAIFTVIYTASSQTFSNVTAQEFKQQMETLPGILIDTRTKPEFARGHILGAVLFDLQDPQIAEKLLQLPKDKPLYLYCYSGSRSRSVASFLAQSSYSNVCNLHRGIIDWTNSGYLMNIPVNLPVPNQPQADAVSTEFYNELIISSPLVFVDFYAPWCAPCKQMMPMIDELAVEYANKVRIVKVNGDVSKELMKAQNIETVPTLILYRDGKRVYIKSGKLEKQELVELFNDAVTK